MAAPIVVDSGTLLADGTEQVLYESTTAEHYTLSVNKLNMASGDTTIIRWYKKVLTGSTQDLIDSQTFTDAQTNKVFYVPHLSCPFGVKFTLEQTGGVNRNYPWSVERSPGT